MAVRLQEEESEALVESVQTTQALPVSQAVLEIQQTFLVNMAVEEPVVLVEVVAEEVEQPVYLLMSAAPEALAGVERQEVLASRELS